jgi:hypothetical protein
MQLYFAAKHCVEMLVVILQWHAQDNPVAQGCFQD